MQPYSPSKEFTHIPSRSDGTKDLEMNEDTFRRYIESNAGFIQKVLLRTPKIWGDPSRIKGNTNVALNDLLLNTRSGDIVIGRNCFFGHGCALLTGSHDPYKFGIERLEYVPDNGNDIIIDDGVWLASYVTVIGPAVLGKDSVAAAGSLIIGDMKPGWLYAGTPAKPIKNLKEQSAKNKTKK